VFLCLVLLNTVEAKNACPGAWAGKIPCFCFNAFGMTGTVFCLVAGAKKWQTEGTSGTLAEAWDENGLHSPSGRVLLILYDA
jgi:hypothetical protein